MTTGQGNAELRDRLLGPMADMSELEVKASVTEPLKELHELLSTMSDAQAKWKPNDGGWSAADVCDHLVVSTGTIGRITRMLAEGTAPSEGDWDAPPHFKEPKDLAGIKMRMSHLPAYTDELFDRSRLLGHEEATANNSVLGDLNWRQWFFFVGVHARDHLRQVRELRSSAGFPAS